MHWRLNDSTRHDRVGSIKRTTEAMHWGHEAGPTKPPGAAAPPRAGINGPTWPDEPHGLGHPRVQCLE
jgi:hypothetical protein